MGVTCANDSKLLLAYEECAAKLLCNASLAIIVSC